MASTISNLELLTKLILRREPWLHDPKVVELPWRPTEFDEIHSRAKTQGLSFGMLKFDGVVMPHAPVLRAMEELKVKLQTAGHEVRGIILLPAISKKFTGYRVDPASSFRSISNYGESIEE